MTPEKTAFEPLEMRVLEEITQRLKTCGRSKAWLAESSGIEYSKVKRLLNRKNSHSLSIATANQLLSAFGSDIDHLTTKPMRDAMRSELNKYND